jgi:hypothetical protein
MYTYHLKRVEGLLPADYPTCENVKINIMNYFLLIYVNNKPLHVSSSLAAHHQEDQLCTNSNWHIRALC